MCMCIERKISAQMTCNYNSKNNKIIKLKQIETCDVRADDEQNPLSLDSPGLSRIAGEIN